MKLLGKPIKQEIVSQLKQRISDGETINPYIIYNSESFEASEYRKLVSNLLIKLGLELKSYDVKSLEDAKEVISEANADKLGSVFFCRPLQFAGENLLFDLIKPSKDADMLSTSNFGKLAKRNINYLSGTARSVSKILDYYNIDVSNKRVLVIGRSISVGMPIALMMIKRNAFVSLSHSHIDADQTRLMAEESDVVVMATGVRGIITPNEVKAKQTIIDCGYLPDGKGDLGFVPDCKDYTPVPGGVGPATIACLIENAFDLVRDSNKD